MRDIGFSLLCLTQQSNSQQAIHPLNGKYLSDALIPAGLSPQPPSPLNTGDVKDVLLIYHAFLRPNPE